MYWGWGTTSRSLRCSKEQVPAQVFLLIIYIYIYIYIYVYIYIYSLLAIPHWLFPIGYSLLAIPMPIRICLCACNEPRPCPAPMCGGRGAVRPSE